MWIENIGPAVVTRVKHKFSPTLKEKYKDLAITTSDVVRAGAKFPTVYIHELPGVEKAQDLENDKIYAVLATVQIDVIDNVSQERASEVMGEIIRLMKEMRFTIMSTPEFKNNSETYRKTARFRKLISELDAL